MAILLLSHPNYFHLHQSHLSFGRSLSHSSLTCLAATSCRKELGKKENSYPSKHRAFLEELYSPSNDNGVRFQTQKTRSQGNKGEKERRVKQGKVISSSMLWADVKAALGQRINLEGIVSSMAVVARDRHLAMPHVAVIDLRYIDWDELQRKGFRGVVFDKDNTLTVPYSLALWGPLRPSVEQCKSVFGNNIAVFSNSAGLSEYDHDGRKARALERTIGIKVIRHGVKKPAGTAEEIENHFGCEASKLIMVGDRPFTDIVFGNRNGFLTILTEPLSYAEEPFTVKLVRKLENALVEQWSKRGLEPPRHRLLPDAFQCVKGPPPL